MKEIILLIDDDADDRAMFCEAWAEVGGPHVDCFAANGARNAFLKLNNGEIGTPNLIFLDVNMPLMTGWQCLSMLKSSEELRHIPVIMYSTSSYPEEIDKAQQLGALCFFTKPADFQKLKASLQLVSLHLLNHSIEGLAQASPLFIAPGDV